MNKSPKRTENDVMREFRKRQTRQIVAIAAALFLVLLGAVLHKRPDLVGSVPRQTIFAFQAIVIAAFLGFTSMNWRCPSCGKHLGGDIHRQLCRKCGTRLQ